jgi:cathepsin X
MSNFDL